LGSDSENYSNSVGIMMGMYLEIVVMKYYTICDIAGILGT
jgi:hypothetical protein